MSNKEYTAALIKKNNTSCDILFDEPMKKHTSFRVGGPVDVFVLPHDTKSLVNIIRICRNYGIPLFIMGNGTNLLVRDKGIRGVVVKTSENLKGYDIKDNIIKADAGMLLSTLSNIAMRKGLKGLEFTSGIPGTLGGAVAMNAGAYGGEIRNVVITSYCVDRNGEEIVLRGNMHEYGYRTSIILKEEYIVLNSEIMLEKGDTGQIKDKMDDLNKKRRKKQPLTQPSAGSTFKRPKGYYAGTLIEDCGLKGFRIGGAKVSEKHCGFIVNDKNASADDIINVISYIRNEVQKKYGVELEPEVKIIGEE
jgi:UDP-N-acetylmuramate dehydrogenase